ncbi:MAG: hypothetical protein ACLP7P_17355 [Rhodomicrobium sp.]
MLQVTQPYPDCREAPAAGEAKAAASAGAETNCLIVGQNGEGLWVVRDRLGLKAGIFSSLESALHFAKEEAKAYRSSVTVSDAVLELGLDL